MYTIYGTVVNLEIRNVLVPVIKLSKNAYMKMSCADLSPPKLNGDGGYLYQDLVPVPYQPNLLSVPVSLFLINNLYHSLYIFSFLKNLLREFI